MKDETLQIIKKEYDELKRKIEENNRLARYIKKLESSEQVAEYIRLVGIQSYKEEITSVNERKSIMNIFYRHINEIKKDDTNGIFIYLGTYSDSYETDIEHGATDYEELYNCKKADYRMYQDLEQRDAEKIPINDCAEFEKNHTVIDPRCLCGEAIYYKIQESFISDAALYGQSFAKKRVLTNRKLMNNN